VLNLYEAVRTNPSVNRLEIGEFLFAEYTCGIGDEKIGLWAHTDYLVNVLTGKKTWNTSDGVWEAKRGDTLFFKKGAAIVDQHFDVEFCLLTFFVPDHLIRVTVREIAGSLGNVPQVAPIKSAARVENDVTLSAFLQSMRTYFSGKENDTFYRLGGARLGVEFVEEVIRVWDALAENPLLNFRRHPHKNIRWRYPDRFPYRVIYEVDGPGKR
jgi:hypothetical protein